jgi:3-hydroxybutyryl-CoA dehydrogenase
MKLILVWDDEISTKAEIDIAMKLGTNYPYGPFEWSEKSGWKKYMHY